MVVGTNIGDLSGTLGGRLLTTIPNANGKDVTFFPICLEKIPIRSCHTKVIIQK